jgi:hypothetical protein
VRRLANAMRTASKSDRSVRAVERGLYGERAMKEKGKNGRLHCLRTKRSSHRKSGAMSTAHAFSER